MIYELNMRFPTSGVWDLSSCLHIISILYYICERLRDRKVENRWFRYSGFRIFLVYLWLYHFRSKSKYFDNSLTFFKRSSLENKTLVIRSRYVPSKNSKYLKKNQFADEKYTNYDGQLYWKQQNDNKWNWVLELLVFNWKHF